MVSVLPSVRLSEVPNGILSRSSNIKEEVREGERREVSSPLLLRPKEERTKDAMDRDPGSHGGEAKKSLLLLSSPCFAHGSKNVAGLFMSMSLYFIA